MLLTARAMLLTARAMLLTARAMLLTAQAMLLKAQAMLLKAQAMLLKAQAMLLTGAKASQREQRSSPSLPLRHDGAAPEDQRSAWVQEGAHWHARAPVI